MHENDRRKLSGIPSDELTERLGSSAFQNVRSNLAPLTSALRRKIDAANPAATPESAEAVLALRFIYRTFLGRRRNDTPDPESMAFARLLGGHIADLATGIENMSSPAEDIPLHVGLALARIDQYKQSDITDPQILLSTKNMPENQATQQRRVIDEVMESFVQQNYQVIGGDMIEPEPGHQVHSSIVLIADSNCQLVFRCYSQPGTAHPVDTELLLLPLSVD